MKRNIVILAALILSICSFGTAYAEADQGEKTLKQYVKTLATESAPGKQRDAFEKMSEFEPQSEEQIDFIFSAIKNDDRKISLAGQRALGNVKDKKLVPKVIAALNDKDKRVKVGAIRAAGRLKDKKAVPGLVKCLDDDEAVTHESSLALAEIGDNNVIPELLKRIGRNNAPTSIGLAKFGLEALRAIKANLDTEAEERVDITEGEDKRFNMIRTIGFIRDPDAVPYLKELLEDQDSDVRISAVQALGKMGELNLAEAMQDKDATVRIYALGVSKKIRGDEVDQIIIDRLVNDDNKNVRAFSANILYERNVYKAIPYLKDALNDTSKDVRDTARLALDKITKSN
ncbi:MAG: HEAT repeat domain-containing protein [Candidatus Electrothrix sp. AW2]|nr:HEAT repeat domain-containing protein [Candidatus Electrothrix gigas]